MIEIIVEDFVAMFSILHGKVVTRTDKEEIPDHVSNHLLVQISIINMFPISVLNNLFSKFQIQSYRNFTWNIIASFSK